MSDEQKMEEGKRMFSIFAARMFEQRVLQAYRVAVRRKILLPLRFDEAHVDGFLVTQVSQLVADREQRTVGADQRLTTAS